MKMKHRETIMLCYILCQLQPGFSLTRQEDQYDTTNILNVTMCRQEEHGGWHQRMLRPSQNIKILEKDVNLTCVHVGIFFFWLK